MNAPIDVSGAALHTRRLTLRPWRQEDLVDFFEYASVEGVGQMAGWLPHKDISETQNILDSFIEKREPSPWITRGRSLALWAWNIIARRNPRSLILCEPVLWALYFLKITGEGA